jgi:hypothetical protein
MANIDVSEVLQDVNFQDSFSVLRSVETVDAHGRGGVTQSTSTAIGVVQPASGRAMELTPDATRTSEMLEIWTQYGLQEATDATQADIVVWRSKQYVVVRVDDWDNWGQGYVHVVLSRKDLLPASRPL